MSVQNLWADPQAYLCAAAAAGTGALLIDPQATPHRVFVSRHKEAGRVL